MITDYILNKKHIQRQFPVLYRRLRSDLGDLTTPDPKSTTNIRSLTSTMMCMHCKHVQPAAQVCINIECAKPISKYYCRDCNLWDDDARKNIYHCHDCGICRIGKGLGQDYFHCKKCNVCMAISLQGKHKCIERNLESDCPICGEYMFTSTTTVIFMVNLFLILSLVDIVFIINAIKSIFKLLTNVLLVQNL